MARDLIGQQLGNYQLVSLLGRGDFAEVYLGQHVELPMQAAIKVLHAHLSAQKINEFQQEAKTIAKLIHPHIVSVLDFGMSKDIPFLVMDYCPNGTLRQRHPKGARLPLLTVVAYVRQIADALQYAHSQKHIHHNVKPENMFIGQHDDILLSDFGIASTAHNTFFSSRQAFVGTPPYMAPEQIKLYRRRESDQYALAIVTYEWLTGKLPFLGTPEEIATKHLSVQPPSLLQKLPNLPASVEEVVFKALAKDLRDRFPSEQDFATALEEASQTKQSVSVPPQPNTTPSQPTQPPVSTVHTPPPVTPIQESTKEMGTPDVQPPTTITTATDTNTHAEDSNLSTTTPVAETNSHTEPQSAISSSVTEIHTPTKETDHSPITGLAEANIYTEPQSATVTPVPDTSTIAQEPDPSTLTVSSDTNTYIESPSTMASTLTETHAPIEEPDSSTIIVDADPYIQPSKIILPEPKRFSFPRSTPQLKLTRRQVLAGLAAMGILVAAGEAIILETVASRPNLSPSNPQLRYTYTGHTWTIYTVAWSADGKRIASGASDSTVQVWNAADGGNAYTYQGHSDTVYSVAWSPDGQRIASGSNDKTVQIWNAADGSHIYTYQGHSDTVYSVAWSPDGQRIASASADKTVQVWNAADGSHAFTYRVHPDQVYAVAWSPDGKRIASGGRDETVQVWDVTNGVNLYSYRGHSDAVNSLAWSSDGTRIASGSHDRTVRIWAPVIGGSVYTYQGHSSVVNALAWSFDGKRIASASNDKTVQVWNSTDGSNAYTYHGHTNIVEAVAWSPDEQQIASGSWDGTVQVWQAP